MPDGRLQRTRSAYDRVGVSAPDAWLLVHLPHLPRVADTHFALEDFPHPDGTWRCLACPCGQRYVTMIALHESLRCWHCATQPATEVLMDDAGTFYGMCAACSNQPWPMSLIAKQGD